MALQNDESACNEQQDIDEEENPAAENDGVQSEIKSESPAPVAPPEPVNVAAIGRKPRVPRNLCLPQVALYQMCRVLELEYGKSRGIAALLRTCKSWRSIVQSAVEHLELQSLSQDSLNSVVAQFSKLRSLEFRFFPRKGTKLDPLASLPLLSTLKLIYPQPEMIMVLLAHPLADPPVYQPPLCPSLTSLTYRVAHVESDPTAPWLDIVKFSSFNSAIISLTTSMVPCPSILLVLSMTFPFLSILDVLESAVVLAPTDVTLLFEGLPLLHTLTAKTRKPMINALGEPCGTTQAKNFEDIQELDKLDARTHPLVVPIAAENRATVVALQGISLPPPAELPASSRIVALHLGYISYENLLAPLGTYFPKLETLACWAVNAADFGREGPTHAEIASHEGNVGIAHRTQTGHTVGKNNSSGKGDHASPTGQARVHPRCFLPGQCWLQRFPVLQTLTLWMDPRDLPCRGGIRFMHLELPRLSTLTLHIKPRPYPVTLTGCVPWFSKLHLWLDGRQRHTFHPMMEGLGELLLTSNASKVTIVSESTGAKFRSILTPYLPRHLECALRMPCKTATHKQHDTPGHACGGVMLKRKLCSKIKLQTPWLNYSGSLGQFTGPSQAVHEAHAFLRLMQAGVGLEQQDEGAAVEDVACLLATHHSVIDLLTPYMCPFWNTFKGIDEADAKAAAGFLERGELHKAPLHLRVPMSHDLWLQPQTPMTQPRILALQGLEHVFLKGIHTITSAQLHHVVAGLPILQELTLNDGCAGLHCLRITSKSLTSLDVNDLRHVLTWQLDCPLLTSLAVGECNGGGLSSWRDYKDNPNPAYNGAATSNISPPISSCTAPSVSASTSNSATSSNSEEVSSADSKNANTIITVDMDHGVNADVDAGDNDLEESNSSPMCVDRAVSSHRHGFPSIAADAVCPAFNQQSPPTPIPEVTQEEAGGLSDMKLLLAWSSRHAYGERLLDALLGGDLSLKLPALERIYVTHGGYHSMKDTLNYPRLILECKTGHPTLQHLVVSHSKTIQGMALQHLPCLTHIRIEDGFRPDASQPRVQWVALSKELEQRRTDGSLEICCGPKLSVLHVGQIH